MFCKEFISHTLQKNFKIGFLPKSHWPKIKISGMVEVGMLMKVHYWTAFGNPVVVPEGDAKFGKKSTCSQRCLCHLALE
jgi:hypothetical protein